MIPHFHSGRVGRRPVFNSKEWSRSKSGPLSRLNDQETASIKADIATLRAQTLAGFASIESRLDAVEQDVAETKQRLAAVERDVAEIKQRLGAIERDVAAIKQALDALPRVLAEEIAKNRR